MISANSVSNDIILKICEELDQFNHMSKSDIFSKAVENKLKASVLYYNNDINIYERYLSGATGYRKDVRVLKAVAKKAKYAERDIIKQHLQVNNNEE